MKQGRVAGLSAAVGADATEVRASSDPGRPERLGADSPLRLLANTPERFTPVGLSLGGHVAFEILSRQPQQIERLALLDTTATA